MEIAPNGIIDISPRLIGAMNLLLTASGICDISEYACGSTWGRSIVQGNYSDINLSIGPFTCIQVTNMMPYSIHIDYAWHTDTNAMVMLVLFWLILVCSCCTCLSAMGVRWMIPLVRHIWKMISRRWRSSRIQETPSAPPSIYSTMISSINEIGNSGEPLRQ